MKIGLIGNGFIGKAMREFRNDIVDVICYDKCSELCEPKGTTITDMIDCEIVFISVPTPMNKDGTPNIDIVKSVLSDLDEIGYKNYTVIRSTVPPGTCDELNVYFMPEFLTERNSKNDFINNELWIYGLLGTEKDYGFKETIEALITTCYENKCIKYNKIQWLTNKEAEMVKYFRNTFLAVKTSYCNELYKLCQLNNIDYENVRTIAAQDKRIGMSHTSVPGPDGKIGFGGTCFPKDTFALLHYMKQSDMKSYILNATIDRNMNEDRKEHDWEQSVGRSVI
tara:strand:- start:1312 stop:2154 length:843 start_codon:yes stop_codon:yes gene_type:complete